MARTDGGTGAWGEPHGSPRSPGPVHSPLRRSFDRALLTLLISGLFFTLLLIALLPLGDDSSPGALVLFPVNLVVYLLAGLLAWYHRPSNPMGALILLAGGAVFLGGAGNTEIPLFTVIGTIGASLPLAVLVHLLLAFPSGKLRGRLARFTVAAAYVTALVLQMPSYLWSADSPQPLSLADAAGLAEAGDVVQSMVGGAVLVLTAALLAHRLTQATGRERRVLVPLYGYGIVAIAVLLFSTRVMPAFLGWTPESVGFLQLAVFVGVPVAFVLAVLRGGVARTGELEELGAWLGSAGDEKAAIASALGRTLGDPSIDVWFWVPSRSKFIDVDGVDLADHSPDDHRGMEVVELDGRLIGAISYDRALMPDPELARTASRVVAIALDRERLTAELRSSRRALQLSRERLVEAADLERRRIAQDLHDGLQVKLVLLALEAQQMAGAAGPEAGDRVAARATDLRRGIDDAATELRGLVHSVMPAPLIQRGLSAAAEDLVDRMPIPTSLRLGVVDGECSPVVESVAYFIVAEALANAVKYSAAQKIVVSLERREESLYIEVSDDGRGGARAYGGSGLLGMSERVDVLGGTLDVVSEPGQGTQITVEVPCG